MAVHPDHPGLTVEFVVDGSVVEEYDDNQPITPNTVTRYVEAVSDATFAIKFRLTSPFPITYGVVIEVRLDGQKVFSSIIRKDKSGNHMTGGAMEHAHGFQERALSRSSVSPDLQQVRIKSI
jgi:hypothetical protein